MVDGTSGAEKFAIRLDFDDLLFQDRLISFLYNELTAFTETVVRYAVKLDRQLDGEDISIDDHPAMRKLAANEFSDPLRHLIAAEDASDELLEHGPHQSRAGVYIYLLRKFDNRMREVAEHLLISRSYCYFRYNEALAMVQRQLPLPGEGLISESAKKPKPWRPFRAMRRWVQVEFDFYVTSELFSEGR